MAYVLVTGCDSGFGKALAEELVALQRPVFLCFHKEATMAAFSNAHSGVYTHLLDVTNDVSVEKMVKYVEGILAENNGELGGVVHSAGGLLVSGPVEWSSIAQDKAQMDLNFFGTLRIVKGLLPLIRTSKGRIVLVSSILGLVGSPFGGIYAASKFAIEGWADALRREMLPFNVGVHLIEPGMVACTNFYSQYDSLAADNWAILHPFIQAAYGQKYLQYTVKRLVTLKNFFGSKSTNPVMHAMMHALFSRWPKHRYMVGFDCSVLGRILVWLPTSLADLALTMADALLLRNREMIPVMPAQSTCDWTGMVYMSVFKYNQVAWVAFLLVSCICFFIA